MNFKKQTGLQLLKYLGSNYLSDLFVEHPKRGVLSSRIWNLAFDTLLKLLNHESPCAPVGFADYGALCFRGIDPETLVDIDQPKINKAVEWGAQNGLTFSVDKPTLVFFSRQQKFHNEVLPRIKTRAHWQRRTHGLQYSLTTLYFGHLFFWGGGDFLWGGFFFFWGGGGGDFFWGGGIFFIFFFWGGGWGWFFLGGDFFLGGGGIFLFTVQYSTIQYSAVQYSTVQYSTVQYSTIHYSTVHSRVQYSPRRRRRRRRRRRKSPSEDPRFHLRGPWVNIKVLEI